MAVKAIAIIPPIDVPWTRTRSSPSASSSFAPSSAQPSIEYHSRGLVEAPYPRASKESSRKPRSRKPSLTKPKLCLPKRPPPNWMITGPSSGPVSS